MEGFFSRAENLVVLSRIVEERYNRLSSQLTDLSRLFQKASRTRLPRAPLVKLSEQNVTAQSVTAVALGTDKYRVRILFSPHAGYRCDCPDWAQNAIHVGPCKHVLALAFWLRERIKPEFIELNRQIELAHNALSSAAGTGPSAARVANAALSVGSFRYLGAHPWYGNIDSDSALHAWVSEDQDASVVIEHPTSRGFDVLYKGFDGWFHNDQYKEIAQGVPDEPAAVLKAKKFMSRLESEPDAWKALHGFRRSARHR